jgi:hypothetical protein
MKLDTLEATFERTHYPEIRAVDDLSSELSLSIERISVWFQNRRARFKKCRKLTTHTGNFDEEENTSGDNATTIKENEQASPTGRPSTFSPPAYHVPFASSNYFLNYTTPHVSFNSQSSMLYPPYADPK